ncbi:hypothetical protein [Flindersiella endophytica]
MLEELSTVRTDVEQPPPRGKRAIVLLVALAVLVAIALGGRWILTREEPLVVEQPTGVSLGYRGAGDQQIFVSLDLQPVRNTSGDPLKLVKAELLPDPASAGPHWATVSDVRVLPGGINAKAASGVWPDDAGGALSAPKLAGFSLPPDESVRLLFVVRLPAVAQSENEAFSMSQRWTRVRLSYDKGGDVEVVDAYTTINLCVPSATACEGAAAPQ